MSVKDWPQALRRPSLTVAAAWILVLVGLCWLLGGRHYGDDAVVLVTFVLLSGGGRRAAVGLLAILLFTASFPPLAWPFYWICCAPLTWLWRPSDVPGRAWLAEAFGVGFSMCWMTSPFVRSDFGAWGIPIQGFASSLFALQVVGIAAGLRTTRRWPVLLAAPAVASVATVLELLRVSLLRWPLLVLAYPAAPTPLAQWASVAGPFGVSFLLYTINFLWLPAPFRWRELRFWAAPIAALGLAAVAWLGGEWIGQAARVGPVPISALVVQPHRVLLRMHAEPPRDRQTAELLDSLTSAALDDGPPVDLIVWPEEALRGCGEGVDPPPAALEPSLGWLFHRRMPDYRTPCLVGAIIEGRNGRRYNSACLIEPDGRIIRYDKRMLIVGAENLLTPGGAYRRLEFADRNGRRVRLGVAICYEMHFPGLPQYQAENRPDVVVHLNNESWYRQYPGIHTHGTWACQYRAIETRTWQLVCAAWTRSAAIDPRGKIRAILPPQASVLRISPSDAAGAGDNPNWHPSWSAGLSAGQE
jgi:apolipoprotein N-acyltransferase